MAAPAGAVAGPPVARQLSLFLRIWLAFFLAAAAGLTVLGQAAGMVEAYGGTKALALSATTAITGCIAAARIGGGWLADRVPAPLVMVGAHLLALSADALLVFFPGPLLAVATLAVIGIGYGLVSGSVAAAIGRRAPWKRTALWLSARITGRSDASAPVTMASACSTVMPLNAGIPTPSAAAAVTRSAVGVST